MEFSHRKFFAPTVNSLKISFFQDRKSKPTIQGMYKLKVFVFEYFNNEIVLRRFKIILQPRVEVFYKPNQVMDDGGYYLHMKEELRKEVEREIYLRIFKHNDHILMNAGGKPFHTSCDIGTFTLTDQGIMDDSEYEKYGITVNESQKTAILSYFKRKPIVRELEQAA